jgi:hypothetical protein
MELSYGCGNLKDEDGNGDDRKQEEWLVAQRLGSASIKPKTNDLRTDGLTRSIRNSCQSKRDEIDDEAKHKLYINDFLNNWVKGAVSGCGSNNSGCRVLHRVTSK